MHSDISYPYRQTALHIEHFGFPPPFTPQPFAEQAQLLINESGIRPQQEGHRPLATSRHRILALGNAAVAMPEFAAATLRQAGAGAWDALHNAFDVMGYLKQLRLIRLASGEAEESTTAASEFTAWSRLKNWLLQTKEVDEAKLEKASFAWISLPAIGAAAIAGAGIVRELQGGGEYSSLDWADWAHLGAAGGALALAFGLWRTGSGMKQKLQTLRSPSSNLIRHVENFRSHAKLDAASSGVALAEAVAHSTGHGTLLINAATLALAGYQTWRFWPSRVSKQSHAYAHQHHDHDDCGHLHLVPAEIADIRARLGWAVRWIGSLASKSQSFLQARQEVKSARREKANELRWWRWVARVSESQESLTPWAQQQLQTIPSATLKMLIRRD